MEDDGCHVPPCPHCVCDPSKRQNHRGGAGEEILPPLSLLLYVI
jgi:hypothetical protein